MKLNPRSEFLEWKEMDKRVRGFKEAQWNKIFAFDPFKRFIMLELYTFLVLTVIIFSVSFYLHKKNQREMDRYLREWHNHKILRK